MPNPFRFAAKILLVLWHQVHQLPLSNQNISARKGGNVNGITTSRIRRPLHSAPPN